MSSTITFDTLKFVRQLEEAGIPAKQAESFVRAQREILSEAVDDSVTTKKDIADLRSDMREFKAQAEGKFTPIQWMLGLVLAGVMALILKSFF